MPEYTCCGITSRSRSFKFQIVAVVLCSCASEFQEDALDRAMTAEDKFGIGYERLRTYDVELEEWAPVNRELRRYGLEAVSILHPSRIEISSDVIVLDTLGAKTLRHDLNTLLNDCEHRQSLVQDLILNNNHLKEELTMCQESNDRLENKAHDLKQMLDNCQYRIKEVEDEVALQSQKADDEEERLRNTKNAAHTRNKHLEHKVQVQEEEIQRLNAKINKLNQEDDRRVLRQHEVFEQLKRRSARSNNTADDKLLDIIDSYENELQQLRTELDLYQGDDNRRQETISPVHNVKDASSNYKGLIKSYDKELRNVKRKLKEVEDKNELLKMEMDSRPVMKDFRDVQQKCKKYRSLLQRHHIQLTDHPEQRPPVKGLRKYSTLADDIDYLPLDHCRRHLKHVCTLLRVEDMSDIPDTVARQQAALDNMPSMEHFCSEVLELTLGTRRSPSKHAVWCEKTWAPVLPTLVAWRQQMDNTNELRQSVSRLASRLVPWKQYRFSQTGGVTDLIEAVDYMASERAQQEEYQTDSPSQKTMEGMVRHFMTLFDVPRLSGVYPRMSEVYGKLGEAQNVIRTLKQLLGLEEEVTGMQVVDAVGRLCQSSTGQAADQLRQILSDEDIEELCKKVELHDEFFPIFEKVVNQLMNILEVKRMEQLVPAVRALKLLTG